ncbi:MAG: hypothetical protein CMJ64_13350 [Planctomycetaceae bacterium]|nr:hypothetical protein [Planctomycetaceae bacterium]
MKARSLLVGAVSVAILSVSLYAAEKIKLEGIKCVINPKGAAKDVDGSSREHRGGTVYFCCANCPRAFDKKIEAKDEVVDSKANAQLVATKQAKQAKCVFTGGPLKTQLTVAGAEVQFCCDKCKGKAEKLEGNAQLVALFGDKAFKKGGFVDAKGNLPKME